MRVRSALMKKFKKDKYNNRSDIYGKPQSITDVIHSLPVSVFLFYRFEKQKTEFLV